MMDGPRRTGAQRTGQLAEAAFAKAVIGAGMLWHPTSAGSDFGIDGKVEIVEHETVRGAEFNVQIKGNSLRGPVGETVSLGLVKVSTLSYWTSKLLPTLLVVHVEATDRLYYGWLHEIVSAIDVAEHRRKRHQRARLSMPARRLSKGSWPTVTKSAIRAHDAVTAAFEHTPMRSYFHVLYCLAADVTDVLIDVLTSIAYFSPLTLAMQFANSPEPKPEDIVKLTERFAAEMPSPPVATIQAEHAFLIMQVEALDHEMQAFLVGKFMFDADNPIVRSTEVIQRNLRELIDDMIPEMYGPEPKGPAPALRWVRVDLVKFVYGVGLVLVLLRDYQRELRPFLFPIWGQIQWPVPSDSKHKPPLSTRIVHDVADELVTNYASRRADPSDLSSEDGENPSMSDN